MFIVIDVCQMSIDPRDLFFSLAAGNIIQQRKRKKKAYYCTY